VFALNGWVKDGGALYLYRCSEVVIQKCLFLMNCAKWGGGLYLERCTGIVVKSNIFMFNAAVRDGGAASVSHSDCVTFDRNLWFGNLALRRSHSIDIHKSTGIRVDG
jgi:hypothetical protein